jgi:hypothetical protein
MKIRGGGGVLACSGTYDWGTMLQAGRSGLRSNEVIEFINLPIILPVVLVPGV